MNELCLVKDTSGNIINIKYPPAEDKYGKEFSGYRNRAEEALYYEFAVLGKELSFMLNETLYYIYRQFNLLIVYNVNLKEVIEEFPNESELIENLSIGGEPIIELLDTIYDINTYKYVLKPYIVSDKDGSLYNLKYSPDKDKYGKEFSGYRNRAEEALYYEFAVLGRDVSFIYKDVTYYLYGHSTPAKVYNAGLRKTIGEYANEMELIESLSIDGKPFVKAIDEIIEVKTFIDVFSQYIALDKDGYPYNAKYPPCKEKYGISYSGYKSGAEETLFYDFGVHGYDLYFKYKGKEYYALTEREYVAVCDEHFNEEYEVYTDAMELLENFKIDGRSLIELIDELDEVDAV